MPKPTIYLDTSVINFLYADDAPEKKEITVDFFDNFVKLSIYDTYVTEYVIKEIDKTLSEDRRKLLLKVIEDYPIKVLQSPSLSEIDELAVAYLNQGILPEKNFFDALHVAFCSIEKIDYLVSWNYRHLANINKERRFSAKNYEMGYIHPFRIVTPTELICYES